MQPPKNHYVKIYETDDYFYEHYNEKIRTDKNGDEYILFRIDICFSDYSLVVDIDWRKEDEDDDKDRDRDLIFELKRQSALKKELKCKFVRISPIKYFNNEVSRIQKFI